MKERGDNIKEKVMNVMEEFIDINIRVITHVYV